MKQLGRVGAWNHRNSEPLSLKQEKLQSRNSYGVGVSVLDSREKVPETVGHNVWSKEKRAPGTLVA